MNGRSRRAFACTVVAFAAALPLASARAQSTPPPESGYVGTGDATVQTAIAGIPLSFGANVAFEERGSRVRLDVLSLTLPNASAGATGAIATQLFPAGGFTVVFDRDAGTYTVWSAARHAYFTSGGKKAGAVTPVPAPSAVPTGGDVFGMFGPLRSLKDDRTLSASIALTGHSTLFGHPVTNLHYAFEKSPLAGNDTIDVHGDMAVAEDVNGVPLQFTAYLIAKNIPVSSLRFELPQLAKRLPSNADFATPPGYARANGIGDAIGGKITPSI